MKNQSEVNCIKWSNGEGTYYYFAHDKESHHHEARGGGIATRAIADSNIGSIYDLKRAPDPRTSILTTYEINRWTTIPIPSEKNWREGTGKDHDLGVLKRRQ